MSTRTATRLALAMGMTSLVLIALGLSLVVLFYRSFPRLEAYANWREIMLIAPIFVAIGTLVAARRPDHPIGWLFVSAGLAISIQLVIGQYAVTSLAAAPGTLPGAIAAWVLQPLQMAFVCILVFLLLLFPTGRLLSQRWQLVAWSFAAGMGLSLVDLGFSPGPLEDFPLENPFGIAGMAEALDIIGGIGLVLGVFGGIFGAVVSLLVRLRRARGLERQQIKWFAYAAVLGVGSLVGANILFPEQMESGLAGSLLWTAAPASLSVAAAIAILRYRLYDIDLIIRRTLIYGALTATLALIYFGSVVLLQGVFRALTGQTSQLVIVASVLVIAALFNPLRRRVQNVIDRRFYRRKYDAAKTLAAFSTTMRDETDLDKLTDRLVDVVQETMQPAHVSLWLISPLRGDPQAGQRGEK